MIISARHCDQKWKNFSQTLWSKVEKLVTRKTASLTHKKTWFHWKKLKSKIKDYQVTSTNEKGIVNIKKAALSFNFIKTQVMSGSQDQKERKTASTVTTIFFGQKVTTAQICFCNDR